MKLIDLRNPLCIEILINGSWSKEIPDDVRISIAGDGAASATERMPKLSDLRDSGSIEQDADIVLFIHREKYQNAQAAKEKENEDPIVSNNIACMAQEPTVERASWVWLPRRAAVASMPVPAVV